MDLIWQNLRYAMIALGIAIASQVCNGCIGEAHIEIIVGLLISAIGWLWGNYVKFGTKAVPNDIAAKPSVPTVSGATGQIQK